MKRLECLLVAGFVATVSVNTVSAQSCLTVGVQTKMVCASSNKFGFSEYFCPGSSSPVVIRKYRQQTAHSQVTRNTPGGHFQVLTYNTTTTYDNNGNVTSQTTGDVEAHCYNFVNGSSFDCSATLAASGVWSDGGVCANNCTIPPYTGQTTSSETCAPTTRTGSVTSTPNSSEYASSYTYTLSDEYTTSDLISRWKGDLAGKSWPVGWGTGGFASKGLAANECSVSGCKMKYRLAYKGPRGERGVIQWEEVFYPSGGGAPQRSAFREAVRFNGLIQYTSEHTVDPPPQNGITTVENSKMGLLT